VKAGRQRAEHQGRRAETVAAWWLRLKGWRIVATRARTVAGEIDLIARRRNVLAFVEVKRRSSEQAAGLSLDEWRLRRVARAAALLAPAFARPGDEIRIDAIFIVPGRWPRHLANIWLGW
jgi:putative endonuclease